MYKTCVILLSFFIVDDDVNTAINTIRWTTPALKPEEKILLNELYSFDERLQKFKVNELKHPH